MSPLKTLDSHISCQICAADVISAVEFDHEGQYLATGDRGGRVVIFERGSQAAVSTPTQKLPCAKWLTNQEFKCSTSKPNLAKKFKPIDLKSEHTGNLLQYKAQLGV